MQEKLKEYARLIVEVGLNIQKGQDLVIACPVDCAYFARLCATAAYELGCREVIMNWNDDYITREKYLKASPEVFDHISPWVKALLNENAKAGSAFLHIRATDPENFKGVDPDRLLRNSKASVEIAEYRERAMSNFFPWCIVSIPIPSWAKKVFPEMSEGEAMEALWQKIFDAVRVADGGDAVSAWQEHLSKIKNRSARLNELHFKALHYTNSIGTDLTVELPENHIWMGGSEFDHKGVEFVANMPTEEVFTAPLKTGVNGTIVASMPLVNNGNVIEGFSMELKYGKIVSVKAEKGEEYLRKAIEVDEGAAYLGEVALVPYDSPIRLANVLFYNTLFDENASCHFAFGNAYPCIEGGQDMSKEQLIEAGLNQSLTHVDFMVGTSDLSIVGIKYDGTKVSVFESGMFVL